jgi:hypothetical protein
MVSSRGPPEIPQGMSEAVMTMHPCGEDNLKALLPTKMWAA